MKYTEIIKLLDAGYTRDEIMKMSDEPEEQGKPEEQGNPEETEEQGEPEEQGKPEEFTGMFKEMKDMFAELRKEVTAFNIMHSTQPEEQNSVDAMAKIINPFDDKGGKK